MEKIFPKKTAKKTAKKILPKKIAVIFVMSVWTK